MNSISANLNVMIKASEKASKILIRDFGEVEKLQVSIKSPSKTVVTLLYPLLDACLHHNTPTNDCPFPI